LRFLLILIIPLSLCASAPIYKSVEDSIYTVHTTTEQKAFLQWTAEYGGNRRGLTLSLLALNETSWNVTRPPVEQSYSPFGIYLTTAINTLKARGISTDPERLKWLLEHDSAFAADLAIYIFDWWYAYHAARVGPGSYAWALAIRSYAEGYDYKSPRAIAYFAKANRWAIYLKPKVKEWINETSD